MTAGAPPRPGDVSAVLLDVEGTTTPAAFVHDVLFPYARARLAAFLSAGVGDGTARAEVDMLRAEHAADRARGAVPPPWREDDPEGPAGPAASYALWLMDHDRKSTALKSLQGRIWDAGYARGELRGQVYPDVPAAFERWRARGLRLAVFSSGSVLAQRRLFATTPAGDLTRHIHAFFDTTTGPKTDPASYRRIAEALEAPPDTVLFLSDLPAELEAARRAGMRTSRCDRGAEAAGPGEPHPVIRSFAEVLP